MITIATKSANYDPENIKFFHNWSYFCFGNKLFSSFVICPCFTRKVTEAYLNKRKVVSGSRVTLPENFAYKPGLSFNPLARVTLAVGFYSNLSFPFSVVISHAPQRDRFADLVTKVHEKMPEALGLHERRL